MAVNSMPEALESIDADSDERISLSDAAQVQRVAVRLGVSAERLRDVVAQVGPRLQDIATKLTQRDSVD
ncbi:MAG: DUF3606 domain-containing protein [Myxococcales bacterium]|nr:MAG: DUF3606 domain-containing protein [Myxococcales bacterium]